LNKLAEKVY